MPRTSKDFAADGQFICSRCNQRGFKPEDHWVGASIGLAGFKIRFCCNRNVEEMMSGIDVQLGGQNLEEIYFPSSVSILVTDAVINKFNPKNVLFQNRNNSICQTNSKESNWRVEGRCPKCGELGKFHHMSLMCSTHGFYAGC